jgi:hypothetical protein
MERFLKIAEEFEHHSESVKKLDVNLVTRLRGESAGLWFAFVDAIYEIVREAMGKIPKI